MRVNVQDEHGASWATFYDAVAVGDIVEWYKADDCWVRYQVTSTPEPVAGASARDFGAEWVTYAGTGCKGAVPAAMRSSIGWEPLPVTSHAVQTPSRVALTPVRHGPWFLHPLGWEGEYEREASYTPTVALLGDEASRGERATSRLPYPDPVSTHELAEARELQFWRDPVLPEGWSFGGALSGLLDTPLYGYCASYLNERGYLGVEICVFFTVHRPTHTTVPYRGDAGIIKETRIIDGHAALVEYSPQGPFHADHWRTVVRILRWGDRTSVQGHGVRQEPTRR